MKKYPFVSLKTYIYPMKFSYIIYNNDILTYQTFMYLVVLSIFLLLVITYSDFFNIRDLGSLGIK